MLSTRLKTFLWIIAIAIIITSQILGLSISNYYADTGSAKVISITVDTLVAVTISIILAIVLSLMLAAIPYHALSYKKRLLNIMPIAVIITELVTMYLVHG